MTPRTKHRPSRQKKKIARSLQPKDINFWVFILTFLAACVISTAIILKSSSENEGDLRQYKPEELSRKLIEVKKSALPPVKLLDFNRFKDSDEKRKAAIDVIFNEMLSQTEERLNIPAAVPPAEVAANSKEDLIRLYGDPLNVPADVYRTACLRIMNSRSDFEKFYQGKPEDMAKIVYEVLCEHYSLGKPPATMKMNELEKYCRSAAKIKP